MEDKKKLSFAEIVAQLNALGISRLDALNEGVFTHESVEAVLGPVEKVSDEEIADDPNQRIEVYYFHDHGVHIEVQYAFWPDHGPGEPDFYTEVTPRKVEITVYENVEGSYARIEGGGFDDAEAERKEAAEELKQKQKDAEDNLGS